MSIWPRAMRCALVGYGNLAPLFRHVNLYYAIAPEVDRFLTNISDECGMAPALICSHSARAGCDAPLYANFLGPVDIQRMGRWILPLYMRYVRRGDAKLHTMGYAQRRGPSSSTTYMQWRSRHGRYIPTINIDADERE